MKRMETTSAAFELRPKVDMRGAKRRSSAWKTCDCETQASQALHSSSIRTAPPVFPAPEPMPWKTPRPSGLTWGTGDQEHPSCDVSWCGPPPPSSFSHRPSMCMLELTGGGRLAFSFGFLGISLWEKGGKRERDPSEKGFSVRAWFWDNAECKKQ